ncbi:hypothetical protein RZS08_62630, partial [Arthrospira platensis SPKY1]|nr:hypothetical protein [Arthrospira platensis SPKY1]
MESELLRLGKPPVELSEMYMVRTIYQDKARNYILRQGKANFSQGALSHDVTRAWRLAGAVPQEHRCGSSGRPSWSVSACCLLGGEPAPSLSRRENHNC